MPPDTRPLDPRLHAYRPDLADARLAGQVSAARFVEGRPHSVTAALVDVRGAPRRDASQTTQALMGEAVTVFDIAEGWAWCQLGRDGYVGYVPAGALAEGTSQAPTHAVAVPSTFLYPAADLKTAPYTAVYMNSPLAVVEAGDKWSRIADGRYAFTRHLRPVATAATDPVAVAVLLEHTPYLWGGRTRLGIDCSGLVQTAFQGCGRACPRDTDMMERGFGEPLPFDTGLLQRGDLVFWAGHVGMMIDSERLIHANGYHMLTTIEPLTDALTRIAALFGPATSFRRP